MPDYINQSDHIHPGDSGKFLFAQKVVEAIEEAFLKETNLQEKIKKILSGIDVSDSKKLDAVSVKIKKTLKQIFVLFINFLRMVEFFTGR